MAQKLLVSDMANLVKTTKLADSNRATILDEQYRKNMLQAAHVLAVDSKNFLETVDCIRKYQIFTIGTTRKEASVANNNNNNNDNNNDSKKAVTINIESISNKQSSDSTASECEASPHEKDGGRSGGKQKEISTSSSGVFSAGNTPIGCDEVDHSRAVSDAEDTFRDASESSNSEILLPPEDVSSSAY